ncbi:MAG: winged helix-turn-helix domain-containing protein [Terriglobales bacterium]|jgi:eukaryotic-like serine/threonine-protein kinase
MQQEESGKILRFGLFEVDVGEGKLTKSGTRIRLQEQPFRILVLLLEHAGQLVTRDAIRQELWAQNTFVEFDRALNTAVGKLRAALSDSAENPRFLETIPRKGYRFISPVTITQPGQANAAATGPGIPSTPAAAVSENNPVGVLPSVDTAPKTKQWLPIGLIAAVLLATAGVAVYWHQDRNRFRITPKDTVVLADFANTTGEAVFDDSLRQALEVGLQQSPFVNVLSDRKVGRILKQMGRPPEERMTGRTAVEVCQRANSKVTVQGSIASLGATYLIGLAAIRCDNGEILANEQLQAKRKEDVVDVLGQATSHMRARLGESLPSIQKFNAPLEQATTASLDALKAYSLALSTWDKKGDRDSLPFFKQAEDLDPNFAMAYGGLATVYRNLRETKLARENAAKAYELRNRVTESEGATIEARYYAYVTGELEKAEQVHILEVQNYQSAGAYNHLAIDEGELGLYEISAEGFRKALTIDPTRANTYSNLATDLLALNRLDEASAVLTDASQRKLQTEGLLQLGYWIAFIRGDSGQMQSLLELSSEVPGAKPLLLAEQSNTEAYYGHFGKARELSSEAAKLMERDGDKESAAVCLAQAAVREAEVGSYVHARELLARAQKLSRGQDVTTLAALAMARMGNDEQADMLSHELDNDWPLGTYVQKYWLPLIRAEAHLQERLPSKAVDDLAVVTPPLEFASPPALSVATLYPTFVRGQAYLAAGNRAKALAEFQKLADHRRFMVNSPLWPLSQLELARAYAGIGELDKARQSCEEFFQLWKGADPDLPLLKEALSGCLKVRK